MDFPLVNAVQQQRSVRIEEPNFKKTIWSIAGGKGGTGKSIIAANLGIGLALYGYNVILIDGDLGGPNLHNYLNMKRPRYTLNDFLSNRIKNLADVLLDTPMKSLKFISDGTDMIGLANLPHQTKEKLIRHINNLSADYILVDLGGGTSINTLDFFNLSTNRIIVSNPEPNAKYDAFYFLKNAILRNIIKLLKGYSTLSKSLEKHMGGKKGPVDLPRLMQFLEEHSKEALMEVRNLLLQTRLKLILNKVNNRTQSREGDWFVNLVKNYLFVDMEYLGPISFDKYVVKASEEIVPYLIHKPKCAAAKDLFRILELLDHQGQQKGYYSYRQFRSIIKKASPGWLR